MVWPLGSSIFSCHKHSSIPISLRDFAIIEICEDITLNHRNAVDTEDHINILYSEAFSFVFPNFLKYFKLFKCIIFLWMVVFWKRTITKSSTMDCRVHKKNKTKKYFFHELNLCFRRKNRKKNENVSDYLSTSHKAI